MKRKLIAILTMTCVLCAMSVPVFGAEKTDAESTAASAGTKVGQPKATTKAYQPCDQTLETEELIESHFCPYGSGNSVLNANHILWMKTGNSNGVKYAKKTGIEKAYSRVYLDTAGITTFQNESHETKTRQNVKEIGRHSLLQTDGTLIDMDTDQVIDTKVRTWYEIMGSKDLNVLVKDTGDVYTFAKGKVGDKIPGVTDVVEITRYSGNDYSSLWFLTEGGSLYQMKFRWGDNNNMVFEYPVLINSDVDRVVKTTYGAAGCYVKNGETYLGEYSAPVFEKEAMDHYSGWADHYFATTEKELYRVSIEGTTNGKPNCVKTKVTDGFKRFTQDWRYELEGGTYYDLKENEKTDVIKAFDYYTPYVPDETPEVVATVQLKTDQCLYLDGTKLLSHVTDFDWNWGHLLMTRTDGTVWLYDTEYAELDYSDRIDPPQKLTEAFVESIYGKEEPPTKPTGDTKNPSGENNTGKSDQNQSPATKAKIGDKIVVAGVTYQVTKNNTVTYQKPKKNAAKVAIPAIVMINGKTYKVTAIAKNAFKGNKKVKTVVVGKNVTTIGASAFQNCKALTTVTLPAKTTIIDKNAFAGSNKLKKIVIKSTKMTNKSIKNGAFKKVSKKTTVDVPNIKAKIYKKLFQKKGLPKACKVK